MEIPATDQLPLPPAQGSPSPTHGSLQHTEHGLEDPIQPVTPQHTAAQRTSPSSPCSSTTSNELVPRVRATHGSSPNQANDYAWSPPEHLYLLHNKPPTKPWAYFIGDSMFKNVSLAGIVSGCQISRKFHPHTESVSWELNNLAAIIPRYSRKLPDGPGLDMIFISVGTNDAARLQRFRGIRNQTDLDHLIHIRIAEWPRQIVELLDGATACLDQFGMACHSPHKHL